MASGLGGGKCGLTCRPVSTNKNGPFEKIPFNPKYLLYLSTHCENFPLLPAWFKINGTKIRINYPTPPEF